MAIVGRYLISTIVRPNRELKGGGMNSVNSKVVSN